MVSGAEIVFAVLQPSNSIFILLVAGALLLPLRRRLGAALLGFAIVLLAAFGLTPLGSALLRPLEAATAIPDIADPPDAVIVLGGFVESKPGGFVPMNLNDNADRLTAAATLAHRWPGVPVVVSEGTDHPGTPPGAELAADWLAGVGVPREQIVVEPRARSTWDNAVFSAELVRPRPDGRYVVVTSAWHMPRSLAILRKAGWPEPIPYPVDPMSGTDDLRHPFSVAQGLVLVDLAAREWSAIGWYALTGRMTGFSLRTPPPA